MIVLEGEQLSYANCYLRNSDNTFALLDTSCLIGQPLRECADV